MNARKVPSGVSISGLTDDGTGPNCPAKEREVNIVNLNSKSSSSHLILRPHRIDRIYIYDNNDTSRVINERTKCMEGGKNKHHFS